MKEGARQIEEHLAKISDGSSSFWIFHPGLGLFLASFLSLFLELLLIRWVPSIIRIMAYYSNLMLLSSFLGLGCGALLARRDLKLYRWFASLFLMLVVSVSAMEGLEFRQGQDELRFLSLSAPSTTTLPIVAIFVLNALVFVPLGDLIGSYFRRLPPLQAYSWDIGGAIAGTMLFGLFSYFWFSPILGCIIVMAIYLIYCPGRLNFIMAGILFVLSLAMVILKMDDTTIWSPYNHITVRQIDSNGDQIPVSTPVRDIATIRDPPFYTVQVNRNFYMWNGSIDGRRYTDPARHLINPAGPYVVSLISLAEIYALPHLIRPGVKEVLVVGSGGGVDVEAALLYGAEHIDAVEIDPVIIRIGHDFNASQSYKDPRVSIHNTDARAFFKQTGKGYDMVVFGFLDSQSLFSQMSNIRLDGYVHTHESFSEAFDLLRDGGILSISFFTNRELWLLDRLVTMVRSATRSVPLVYIMSTGQVTILAGKGFVPQGPNQFISYRRIEWTSSGTPDATDDWPYLYLRQRFIPFDYLITIGILLAISLLFVFLGSEKKKKGTGSPFFLSWSRISPFGD